MDVDAAAQTATAGACHAWWARHGGRRYWFCYQVQGKGLQGPTGVSVASLAWRPPVWIAAP